MTYIDAYVLPVHKDRIEEYKAVARKSASLWKEYGAIGYVESVADDAPVGTLTSFPRSVLAKDDETVILSWILYPSRAIRDEAAKKMMADPRMKEMMDTMPVDGERMIFGGFEAFIED